MPSLRAVQLGKETSAQAFRTHVWPLWQEHLGANELHSVEDRDDRLSRLFDSFGTDGFYIKDATGAPIPLASRVEFKRIEPRFTLRYRVWDFRAGAESSECEFMRKVRAMDDPESRRYLPLYTIQSSVVAGSVRHSLMVRTEDLIEFARANEDAIPKHFFKGTRFMVIPADGLRSAGVPVWERP